MKKWDKVTLRNMPVNEFLDLSLEDKETFEINFGEVGIILNEIVEGSAVVVGFPRGVETVPRFFLEQVQEEISIAVRVVSEGPVEIVEVKAFKDILAAAKDVFEYENRDGIDKFSVVVEVE